MAFLQDGATGGRAPSMRAIAFAESGLWGVE